MKPSITVPPTSGKVVIAPMPGEKRGSVLADASNPNQPKKSPERKVGNRVPPKLIRTKPAKLTVQESKIDGALKQEAEKNKAERVTTTAMLALFAELEEELSPEIGGADPKISPEPSSPPKTPAHAATGASYPEPLERLSEILVELNKLDQGHKKLVSQNALNVGPGPSKQPADVLTKDEIERLNADLDTLDNAIDNPEVQKQPVTDVPPAPEPAQHVSLVPASSAQVASRALSLHPNLRASHAQAKAKKLVTDKKKPWTVKPSQPDGAAPKNQKVALKKHAKQPAQPAQKPAVQASVVAIQPKRFNEIEPEHLELFSRPLSSETNQELKKSLAKTTMFGFKPKWFKEHEKDLLGHIGRFRRIILDPKTVYTNQNYINAADSIIVKLELICEKIKAKRPGDASISLLEKDIAELRRVYSQYL